MASRHTRASSLTGGRHWSIETGIERSWTRGREMCDIGYLRACEELSPCRNPTFGRRNRHNGTELYRCPYCSGRNARHSWTSRNEEDDHALHFPHDTIRHFRYSESSVEGGKMSNDQRLGTEKRGSRGSPPGVTPHLLINDSAIRTDGAGGSGDFETPLTWSGDGPDREGEGQIGIRHSVQPVVSCQACFR